MWMPSGARRIAMFEGIHSFLIKVPVKKQIPAFVQCECGVTCGFQKSINQTTFHFRSRLFP